MGNIPILILLFYTIIAMAAAIIVVGRKFRKLVKLRVMISHTGLLIINLITSTVTFYIMYVAKPYDLGPIVDLQIASLVCDCCIFSFICLTYVMLFQTKQGVNTVTEELDD